MIAEAIAAYKKAIRLNPDYETAHYHLGLAYRIKEDNQSAIEAYLAAIRLNPNNGLAHQNLALTYYYIDQYDRAWEHARSAEKLGHNTAGLMETLRKVSSEPNARNVIREA